MIATDLFCPHCGAPPTVSCKEDNWNCIERSQKALVDAEVARLESGTAPSEDEMMRVVDASGLV